jgi:hypothetical protein
MDKALFRAYVKELVKEQIEESVEKAVKKILPEVLGEAIAEIKGMQQVNENVSVPKKPALDRSRLAQLMGLERHGDTITATTSNVVLPDTIPQGVDLNSPSVKPAVDAITKDYSALMKKMGLSK